VHKADNLTTILGHCHIIWEPSLPGTLCAPQACNGTDLPFTLYNCPLKMGLMGCPESLQRTENPCCIPLPAEQKPKLHHSRSLKSCKDEILVSCSCQGSSSIRFQVMLVLVNMQDSESILNFNFVFPCITV